MELNPWPNGLDAVWGGREGSPPPMTTFSANPRAVNRVLALAVLLALLGRASASNAQQLGPPAPPMMPPAPPPTAPSAPPSLDGSDVQVRIGHIEGQGVPQVDSLTPVELFPYVLDGNSLFFSDLRFYTTNELFFGGNAGLGYRYYNETIDRVFGISAWYDADNTRDLYFQQLGLGLETYAWMFDLRANLYLPVGPTQRQTSLVLVDGSTQFSDDHLVYDLVRTSFVAMRGYDFELGVPLPTEFARQHGLRIYGGTYLFETEDKGTTINGWSGRVQANLIAGLDAAVQVTHDDFYQTRAFASISWTFGPLHPSQLKRSNAFGRIGEHVTRNYTVLAPQHVELEHTLAANPQTGTPYTFAHVSSSAAPGGSGGINDPFQDLTAAQASGRDILYVHAGSVLNGAAPIVLAAGQRLLGDSAGAQYYVQAPELGQVVLPHGSTAGVSPILNGATGDAIVLASGSEVSGFRISNVGGHGITAANVQDALLTQLTIDQTGGDGLHFVNTSGTFGLSNVAIANTAGKGISVQGGSAATEFLGTTTISNATGPAVSVKDISLGSSVQFGNLAIDHRHDRGIEVDNSFGLVKVSGQATVTNENGSTASALDVRNSAGVVEIERLDVTAATGSPGVNLQDNAGRASFGTLNIASQNTTGLRAMNAGTLTVNPAVDDVVDTAKGGVITAVDGTAVDVQNTLLAVNFNSVSASNAARGISLVNTGGLFVVMGTPGVAGSGGTIQNTTSGIFLQNTGLTAVQSMNLTNNTVGIQSENSAEVAVLHSTVQNSTSFGIDVLDTRKLRVLDVTMNGNGAANIRGQFAHVGTYTYTLYDNNLTTGASDNVVFVVQSGGQGSTMNLDMAGGEIKNTLAATTGLKLDWNGVLNASVNDVTFTASGGQNLGASIHNLSATGLSTVTFVGSGFKGTGGQDTALDLLTGGPSQITVTNNTLEFNGAQNTGIKLALAAGSATNLSSNHIFDTVDGTTAILFQSITGPGTVTLENNLIDLEDQGGLLDQGIVFQSITNNIELIGTISNTINNADTTFFAPPGSTTGSILVNGVAAP